MDQTVTLSKVGGSLDHKSINGKTEVNWQNPERVLDFLSWLMQPEVCVRGALHPRKKADLLYQPQEGLTRDIPTSESWAYFSRIILDVLALKYCLCHQKAHLPPISHLILMTTPEMEIIHPFYLKSILPDRSTVPPPFFSLLFYLYEIPFFHSFTFSLCL